MTQRVLAAAGDDRWRKLLDYGGLLAALALLILYFGLTTDRFFTPAAFHNIASSIPTITVLAVGMTCVLIVGGIDLSVGSVLALSGSLLGILMAKQGIHAVPAVMLALAAGLGCGLLNGGVTALWGVPSFIVTLGMLEAARGGAQLISNSRTQYIGAGIEGIAEASLLGVPLPFVIALLVVIGAQVMLTQTSFGRHMMAVGANAETARLSGINPVRVRLAVFSGSGLLAGLAAVLTTARLGSADPNAGTGLELQAIAAAVIGGTSLMGGRGSAVGSFLGVLIMAVLGTGLVHKGAGDPSKRLITGAVIVAAVVLDHYRRKFSR